MQRPTFDKSMRTQGKQSAPEPDKVAPIAHAKAPAGLSKAQQASTEHRCQECNQPARACRC